MDRSVIGVLLLLLSGCAAIDPQTNQLSNDVAQIGRDVKALQSELAETRQHLRALDITERTAQADLAERLEQMNDRVNGLPRRISNQCKPATSITAQCDNAPQTIEMSGEKAVLGELEEVWLAPPGLTMVARMDTGATSSSLHAVNLVHFERDGEDWVRFDVAGKDETLQFEAAVVRNVRVVQQADPKGTKRPVVAIRVRVGGIDENVEFTLADRSHLENPLILGRNFLKDLAVVDVGREFVQPAFTP